MCHREALLRRHFISLLLDVYATHSSDRTQGGGPEQVTVNRPLGRSVLDNLPDGIKQEGIVERLFEKGNCPGGYRLLAELGDVMRRHKDDRNEIALEEQLRLELDPAHARHREVGDQAPDIRERAKTQER